MVTKKYQKYSTALEGALSASTLGEVDSAGIKLARDYANAYDENPALALKTGHQFLALLDSLGLTPKGRQHQGKAADQPPTKANPLDELKRRRAARG